MCNNWKKNYASKLDCNNLQLSAGEGEFTVNGNLKQAAGKKIQYWAAAPPTYINSYSGSGLPYPNQEVAYDTNDNKGVIEVDNSGNFTFQLKFPNAYYSGLGTNYVEPCFHVKVCDSDEIHTFQLNNGIPYRMMTYPNHHLRTSPFFYQGRDELPIRNQEQILRDSGYPSVNKMPENFWGTKPPM